MCSLRNLSSCLPRWSNLWRWHLPHRSRHLHRMRQLRWSLPQRSNRSRRIINCTYYRNTKAEPSTGGSAFTFHSVKRVTCSIIESLHVFCLNFFATWSDYAYLCRCKMPMKGRNITELLIYSLKYQQNNGKLQRSWLGQHPWDVC